MAEKPPSTDNSTPFTKLESSEGRNNATVAISSGRPIFPRGIRDSNICLVSLSRRWESDVSTCPGLSTFTRIFLPFSSLSHVRANQRNAALLAAYTPKPGKPFTEATGPDHDDRSAIVEQRQRLLNRKQRSAHDQVEARIEVLLGNLAQFGGFTLACARKQDVDLALFPLDCVEQTVEVVEIGRVAAHAGHVPANQLDGLIERLLPPARDENVGAFFNEPLGALQRQAARSTRDDCNFSFKLSHNYSLR